jgi:hypothetical protein
MSRGFSHALTIVKPTAAALVANIASSLTVRVSVRRRVPDIHEVTTPGD